MPFTGASTITINNLTINGGNLRSASGDSASVIFAGKAASAYQTAKAEGLDDAFGRAICLVEWPDRLGTDAPPDAITLTLTPSGDGRRAEIGFGKRGDLMATFIFEDLSGSIEAMVFPKTMLAVGGKLFARLNAVVAP